MKFFFWFQLTRSIFTKPSDTNLLLWKVESST